MSPALEAAFRLASTLPTRTHYQPERKREKVGLKPGQVPENVKARKKRSTNGANRRIR